MKYVSVFIPVYNGEQYLKECLDAVLSQQLPDSYELEVLVTDSGSTDASLDILQSFGDKITLKIIPNSEFGHGKTRQAAAEKAKGEYILFLSQDATPQSDLWLQHMIEPFFISPKVGCVFGRQVPRPDAAPTIKREVSSVFNSFGPVNSVVLHNKKSLVGDRVFDDYNYFFSDVNSAIRKDLVTVVPFRDVQYAEDMALAEDMEKAGYIKAYSARGAVWHSNMYSASEYYHRKFDEYLGLIKSTSSSINISKKELVLGWLRPTLHDWSFIRQDSEYGRKAKVKFALISPIYNINEKRGKRDALRFADNNYEVSSRSLEAKRKR